MSRFFYFQPAVVAGPPPPTPGDAEFAAYQARVQAKGFTLYDAGYTQRAFRLWGRLGLLEQWACVFSARMGLALNAGGELVTMFDPQNTQDVAGNDWRLFLHDFGSTRPLHQASGYNGRPVVEFRSGELIRDAVNLNPSDSASFFTLSRINQTAGFVFEHAGNYNDSGTFTHLREGPLVSVLAQVGGGNTSFVTEQRPVGPAYLTSGTVNRSRSTQRIRQRVNGHDSTVYTADGGGSGPLPDSHMVLAGRPNIPSYRLQNGSWIAENWIAKTDVGAAAQTEIDNFLRTEYGHTAL